MSHHVLAHGAFEGSWSWKNIPSELRKIGHEVTAVDLPGSLGNDRTIPEVSMESYVGTVAESFIAKITVSDEKFGSIPKTYIRTDIDKVLTPAQQNEMVENWKTDQIFVLNSRHFPALYVPQYLVGAMI